jgi:phosphoribosylformylglycinamidine (FGAM) synthase-like enzyme
VGATISIQAQGLRSDQILFNESQSRVIVSLKRADIPRLMEICKSHGLSGADAALELGSVTRSGEKLRVTVNGAETTWSLNELYDAWWNAIGKAMA